MCNSSACAFQTRGPEDKALASHSCRRASFCIYRSASSIFLGGRSAFCITHVGKMRGAQNNRTELEKQVPVLYVHRK